MLNAASEIREAVLEGLPIRVIKQDGIAIIHIEGVEVEIPAHTAAEALRDLATIVEGKERVTVIGDVS